MIARVLGGLACLLVAVGCAPTESMRWHSLMRAAEQAHREGSATEAEETWRKAIAEVGPDDWRAAPTLERLGRFYEAQGERRKPSRRTGRLWRSARSSDRADRPWLTASPISPRGEARPGVLDEDLKRVPNAQTIDVKRYAQLLIEYDRAVSF